MVSEYTIQVSRKGGECVASISELCIAKNGVTPQEAISAVLQAEEGVLKTLEGLGTPSPPAADHLDPFPKITQWISVRTPFFAKVAVGYVLVASMTVALFAIIFPTVRSKAESYVLGDRVAIDTGKVLSRMGISLCLEKP